MLNFHQYLTSLNVLKYENFEDFSYTCQFGKLNHSFIFIIKGTAEFITENEVFNLTDGDMVYIPKWQKYTSIYKGNKGISYCNIVCSFSPDFPETEGMVKIPSMQKLRYLDYCTDSEIDSLHKSFFNPETSGTDTIIRFYQLYSKIYPNLRYQTKGKSYNPVQPAIDYMKNNVNENYSIGQLAEMCRISETYFYRLFKSHLHCTPVEYKNRIKIQKAMVMLISADNSISEISLKLGFSSDDYFTKIFKKTTGFTPSHYRKMQNISANFLQ